MMSGKQSFAPRALALALLLTLALPSAAALPIIAYGGPGGGGTVDPDDPTGSQSAIRFPGSVIRINERDRTEGGVNELVERIAEYVEDFDPHDDLPTQVARIESLAVDSSEIVVASLECIVFVADPGALLQKVKLDLSGAPDRVSLRIPAAMADGDSYQAGYLLIELDFTGELECGITSNAAPLA